MVCDFFVAFLLILVLFAGIDPHVGLFFKSNPPSVMVFADQRTQFGDYGKQITFRAQYGTM